MPVWPGNSPGLLPIADSLIHKDPFIYPITHKSVTCYMSSSRSGDRKPQTRIYGLPLRESDGGGVLCVILAQRGSIMLRV
jgi:Predicted small secreted protein